MVVVPVYTKPDDQFPLLMVAGAGDAAAREPPPVVVDSMIWNSSAAPRRPWSERWPEYLSTCWMTIILLGISFLVFYAVGMVVVYRHESFILVKCNDTKPASEVFYHSIIPRGGAFPLANYAEYLSNMATLYPNLRFNVHFLIDDSKPAENRLFDRIYPYSAYTDEYNTYNRREVRCFQKKHPNVNVTVMLLSKYMAVTPLKYRWRNIPTQSIPFYARIFSVWSNAGIGLDIAVQNQQYHLSGPLRLDRKIKAILKQHNDGISPEKYMEALKRVDETEHEYLAYIVETVQRFFIESLFNKTMVSNQPTNKSSDSSMEPLVPSSETKSLIRTHRSKRDVFAANQNNTSHNDTAIAQISIVLANSTNATATSGSYMHNMYQITANEPNENTKTVEKITKPKLEEDQSGRTVRISDEQLNGKANILKSSDNIPQGPERNKSDFPQIVLFYDLSVISEPLRFDTYTTAKNLTSPLNIVTIETDGTFVASTSHLHPFLGAVFSGACRRLPPKFAIQNALLTRCPGTIRDEKYCNSIFLL